MGKRIIFTDVLDDTTLEIMANEGNFQLVVKSTKYNFHVIHLDEETAKKFSKHTRTVIADVIANKKEANNG
tara:strand:+ start:200 stop:412 length:213 start_codon:yes stop_codon:yes gene_type:complete